MPQPGSSLAMTSEAAAGEGAALDPSVAGGSLVLVGLHQFC